MSEEEEAEALARALEGGEVPAALGDVVETAHAMQTRRAALLQAERAQAVLAVVEERLARARRRRLILAGAGAVLAMAAAVTLVFVRPVMRSSEPARTSATSAPRSASQEAAGGAAASELERTRTVLLAAQRAATRQRADDLAPAFEAYRQAYYASLEASYP